MKKMKVFLGIILAVVFSMPVCNAFTDMDANHWAYETVNRMTEKGILSGFLDDTFRPDDYISREQFATILIKTVESANIELPINTENSWNFEDCVDVDENRWSYEYIEKAFNVMGKVDGKNDGCYFAPDALMSREEVAKIMVNVKGLGREEADYSILDKFSDKNVIGSSYEEYVAIAVENGIMSGNADSTFAPKKNLTRAQIATLMSKLLDEGKNAEIISDKYVKIYEFSEGLAKVQNNEAKWGYINTEVKEVIPCVYDEVKCFSEGVARVEKNGKWGYINKDGKEIVPCIYDEDDLGDYSEGLAKKESDEKYDYINTESKEGIIYDYVSNFSEGLACVEKDWKWGYINIKGEEVIPCEYNTADIFSEGLARVEKDWKWGYINTKGEEVIPLIYYMARNFSDGMALVINSENKGGFIDKEGKETIPCIYDYEWDTNEDKAYLCLKRSW